MANYDMEKLVLSDGTNNYILKPDTTLAKAGVPADAKKAGEEIESLKEDVSDLSDTVDTVKDNPVALAEQLDSKIKMIDQVPYAFRKTPTGAGNRLFLDKIVGGTVAWNQLVIDPNFEDGTKWEKEGSGSATFAVSDNVITVTYNGQSGGANVFNPAFKPKTEIPFIEGHVYYISVDFKSTKGGVPYLRSNAFVNNFTWSNPTTTPADTWKTYYGIRKAVDTINGTPYMGNAFAGASFDTGDTISARLYCVYDLTAMFGSTIADYIASLETATAGAGVALFRSLFPNDYYAYNAVSLQSVQVSAHKMVGFNAWDEQWELGSISPSTGENATSNAKVRSKNYIQVLPNTEYCFTGTLMYALDSDYLYFYDANKNFIKATIYRSQITSTNKYVFTTPDNAMYMRFIIKGTSYGNNICINISDTTRNGQYEPYNGHSYPLDASEVLRGVWKLDANNNLYCDGDIKYANGKKVVRYGIIDLGTLDWTYDSTNQRFKANISNKAGNSSANIRRQRLITNAPYDNIVNGESFDSSWNKVIYNLGGDELRGISIHDHNYSDATTFKTAMSNYYLVYELATPTTEDGAPFQNMQIVDPDGTEEFVDAGVTASTPTRDVSIPAGHYSEYPTDQVAKLDGLPSDFSTLIAPVEKGFTATQNYTAGSLLIVNNVLYKVTANIANGGTITVGTNVTAKTLAEVIAEIIASING